MAAGAVSAALVAVGAPASAQAAGEPLVIDHAYSERGQEVQGRLWVSITAAHPVTGIRAEVIHPATGQLLAEAADFVPASDNAGTWVTRNRLLLGELGRYDVNVEATDAAGNKVRRERVGTGLSYQVVPFITDAKADPGTIDAQHREVTVRGVLQGRWPGTGEVRPLAGLPVTVRDYYYSSNALNSGADGSFAVPITLRGDRPDVLVGYEESVARPGYATMDMVSVPITVTRRATRVTAEVDRRTAVAGEPVRITGVVSQQVAGGWEPVRGARRSVGVELCVTNCQHTYVLVDTDPNGRYEAQVEASLTGHFRVRFQTDDAVDGSFLAAGSADTALVTVTPAG